MTKVMAVISEIRWQKDSDFCLACVLWLSFKSSEKKPAAML